MIEQKDRQQMNTEAVSMHGKQWEYVSYYLPGTPRERFTLLAGMEDDGWDVLNVSGASEGNDVIWFKRKLKATGKAPAKRNPCKHGIEDYGERCIYCGPPI